MTVKHSETDVLIIGAGPSGYMCATWLARCGIPFRIIDKRSNEIFAGQADGLQSRTLEIFKSFSENCFDFATLDQGWKVANHVTEMCFWSPNDNGYLTRKSRVPDSAPGVSKYTECVIHQGNVEKWFNDSIEHFSDGKVKVERPLLPISLQINENEINNPQAHAVDILIKKLADNSAKPEQFGKIANGLFRAFDGDQEKFYKDITKDNEDDYELIHAKYVVGSDGAHSWVRKQFEIDMDGDHTDFVWGVLDMVPITNFPDIRSRCAITTFPDIRSRCAIHSKESGSVMVIPRENDLDRFYIQLKEVEREESSPGDKEFSGTVEERRSSKGRIDRSKITPESILKQAQEIFHPYSLEMTDLHWYTGYQIGQRVSPKFSSHNRVFISGDACHTHSPKAGQGMNVSMQDTYNLGFKLALVCKGLSKQDILSTYQSERLKVARDLIAFDHKLSRLFSGKPMIPNSDILDGVDMDEFHQVYLEGNKFASGTIVDYEDSLLINKSKSKQDKNDDGDGDGLMVMNKLAPKIPIGRRLYSVKMISQADGRPIHIADRLSSDGRFRVLIFPGDIKQYPNNLEILHSFQDLLDDSKNFLKKFTPLNAFQDSVIDIITIHNNNRHEVEIFDFPNFTHPLDYKHRCDYWKLYSGKGDTYHEGKINMYDDYGIDPKHGVILVIRPDSHVAKVVPFSIDGLKQVDEYFKKFRIDQSNNVLASKPIDYDDSKRFIQPRLAV
uniref:Phenol hydroxylase n=1 Tax=Candida tropicalis TaxID=5482 RepID=A0SWL3_CANTR|nr:phenol hydroxylase [Candida tropicalis]